MRVHELKFLLAGRLLIDDRLEDRMRSCFRFTNKGVGTGRSLRDFSVFLILLLPALVFTFQVMGCSNSPAAIIDTDGDEDPDGEADGDQSQPDGDGEDLEGEGEAEAEEGNDDLIWLDEMLGEGQVRGGIVRRESELPTGVEAECALDDFKLYNDRVAFCISRAGVGRAFNATGGTIIDAVRMGADGQWGPDLLVEAFPMGGVLPNFLPLDGGIREFHAGAVELVHNGSDGRAAHVQAKGYDGPLSLIDELMENPTYPDPLIKLSIDYFLDADSDYLRVQTTATIYHPPDEFFKEAYRPGLGVMSSDKLKHFYPGRAMADAEEEQWLSGFEPDYYAFIGPDVSYAVAGGKGRAIYSLLQPFDTALLMSQTDLVVSKNGENSQSETVLFYVGDGSADGLFSRINDRRLERNQAGAKALTAVSGRVELFAELAGKPIEVLAVRRELHREEGEDPVEYRYSHSSTWLGDDLKFEFSLVPGDYDIYARTNWGELSGLVQLTLNDGEALEGLILSSPPRPAIVRVSVLESVEGVSTGDPLPARVDFYRGALADITKGSKPVTTVFSGDKESTEALIPLAGDAEAVFTIIVSHGIFYSMQSADSISIAAGEMTDTIEFSLERVVDPTYLAPSGDRADGDVDGDGPQPSTGSYFHHAVFNGQSERSVDSRLSRVDKLRMVHAEGLELFVSTDRDTVADYAAALDETGVESARNRLYWFPGMKVRPPWSSFSALNVVRPEDSLTYYGVPIVDFGDNGLYLGRRPAPGIWNDMREDYQASLIQVNHPRGRTDSFFDYFGSDPEIGYDPHLGIDTLAYEARSSLNDWDTLEILSPEVDFINSYGVLQDWLSLLHQGVFKPLSGNSDLGEALNPGQQQRGWARNLVIGQDENLDREAATRLFERAGLGHSIVSLGPTLKIDVEGAIPGGTYDSPPSGAWVDVNIKIEAPLWVPINALQLCVNGQPMGRYYRWIGVQNKVLRDEAVIRVDKLAATGAGSSTGYQDMYIAAVVMGSDGNTLTPVYPGTPSFAISNPIFIEADGEPGFTGPGVMQSPYCISQKLCELFVPHDDGRYKSSVRDDCCNTYPEQPYCPQE